MLPNWLRGVRRRLFATEAPYTIRTHRARRARLAAVELEERLNPATPLVTSVFQNGVDTGGGVYSGTKDTEVRRDGANATTNFATATTVLIDWPDAGGTNDTQALLRFNSMFGSGAGQIPLGAKIVSAVLHVNTTNPGDGGEFHRMLVDWQDTVTWNTATGGIYNGQAGIQADGAEAVAAFDSSAGIDTLDQDVPQTPNDIDVTRDLQAWSNGATNFGWAILPWSNGTDGWEFNQSENATISNRPKLTVQWVPAATSSASFQQGTNGYTGAHDTWLQENAPDANNATTSMIFVDQSDPGAANQNQVLLRFDNIIGGGANQIPANSTILGATLRFETTGANAQGDGGHFNRMLTSWTDTSTWNSLNNGIQTNDAEAVSTYDSFAGNPSLNPNYTNWSPIIDVTADVQAWANGLANNGWAMIPWIGGSDGWGIRTSEYATVAGRPQLTVFFGPPPAAPPVNTTLDIAANQLTMTTGSTAPNNNVTLSLTGGNYTINDSAAVITLSSAAVAAGWTGTGTNTVTGPDASVSSLSIDLNLGNDTFTLNGINDPLTVTGGGQTADALNLPVSLNFAGSVSLTGFGTATQTTGTTLTIGTLTIGANTIATSANPLRTTAGTVNLIGGSGGVFETETDGANFSFRATGSGQVRITNLAGTLTIADSSFGGAGSTTLTSPDAVVVNAAITTNGPVSITANTDGAGTQGFTQGAAAPIVAGGSASDQAFSLVVNTASGGTGSATFSAGVATAPGGTIAVDTNGGNITLSGGNTAGTAGGILSSGAGGDSSTVRLNGAAIGTATSLIRTSTGHIRATGGNGGVFVSETSDSPGAAQATATGAGSIRLVAASATNNGMIIDGPVWTQTGNIALEADDDLILEAPVGGSMNGQNFGGTVTCLASLDLVNEQLFRQDEDSLLGHSGSITTTNTTANAVSIQVSATTTGAGVGGGAILGHITTGPGGTITVNTQAGTRADRAGRILMTPGGLLDTGPTGRVVLQAKDNSIGEAISPIMTTAGTVTATTNSTDPATSLAPLQLPGSIYVTTVGPASFAATTTTAATNVGEIVLTTQSGILTVNGATRTDSGQITLNGAAGVTLTGAIGGTGESGNLVINAGTGNITQSGGSIVTTGGLQLTGASAALNQAANDAATVAANLTATISLADANSIATGTVGAMTGITAVSTTVTGGRLNVVANVTGPVVANANGTVGGTGTIGGALTANASGKTSPGTSPGRLTVNGNVIFAPGSTFEVELNGTTVATQYDQLTVNGTVNLGGATLAGILGAGFSPPVGTAFTIIDNDGTDAVTGTFAGLAPGALVSIGGQSFSISYSGGTGNDVILTRSSATAPAVVSSVVVNAGQTNLTQRSQVTNVTVTFDRVVSFTGAAAAAFQLARTGPGTPTGNVAISVDTTGSTATQTVAKLTFSGSLTEGSATAPSLVDGNYSLTVFGGQVQGGIQGGDNVSTLFRLFGDVDGNKSVNGSDLNAFRAAFGTNQGDTSYQSFLDFDGNGAINGTDLGQFRSRFGVILP